MRKKNCCIVGCGWKKNLMMWCDVFAVSWSNDRMNEWMNEKLAKEREKKKEEVKDSERMNEWMNTGKQAKEKQEC